MRYESSITSISWLPSEAIPGIMRLPFDLGPFHYDDPPPDTLTDLQQLLRSGAIRFANELRAWIEVEDGRVVEHGQSGRGWMGKTKLGLGSRNLLYPTIGLPDIRPEAQVSEDSVRFTQTAGGRPAVPMPRRLNRAPFVQIIPPVVWTTLALTIDVDGSSARAVIGASPIPRHWIYDDAGKLAEKVAVTDFRTWSAEIFGEQTPWGSEDSPAYVTQVESALERQLSLTIMRAGAKPRIRKLAAGETLVKQGEPGVDIFLILDGVLSVEVAGESLAELGPGAIVGERASLEGGLRTSTLRAVTPARVAVAAPEQLSGDALAELAFGHQREQTS